MSAPKIIDSVLLNLLNIDDENVRLLTKQKIIPLTLEEFKGVTIMDDNIRNLNTVVWDEETGKVKSWHFGTMEMVVESWDDNGIVTRSDVGQLVRRDYFTTTGALWRTTIADNHDNCFEQTLIEFNDDGVVKAETITHIETYNDSLDPEKVDIRLIKGGSSTEHYRIVRNLQTHRTDSEGNVIEEYIYDEDDKLVAVDNGYHRTTFEYDEFDNVIKITKAIIAEHQDDLDETTEIKIVYGDRWPGQIELIEIEGQIIFSTVRFWMGK